MKFLKLIRFQNLLFIAFTQIVIRLTLFEIGTRIPNMPGGHFLSLSTLQFAILVLATVCIAAAGYIINDIQDQETDAVANKRIVGVFVSENTSYNLYAFFNIIGVGLGFYLSNSIDKPSFAAIFVFIAALLYIYATNLKQIPLIGNIIIAAILGLSVLILGFFDLYPATFAGNRNQMHAVFSLLRDFALFAFLINFLREIIKDLQDYDADKKTGVLTLPVWVGIPYTKVIVLISSCLFLAYTFMYAFVNFIAISNLFYYFLLFVIGPLLLFVLKLISAKTTNDFKFLSGILKATMFFGVLTIVVIYIYTENA